ncbi:MAG: sigma-70 family RNA polymerase sigma factor [Pseudomonadales bacterium]|nr:sigma-70 family RNA polymerase sigma factor [Pseudomonadales bacterium]
MNATPSAIAGSFGKLGTASANVTATDERGTEALQVRAVAGGDRDAFAALCRRHAPVLHRFATRMLGEPADAEDVVQETLLRFWREAGRFDASRARLSTWLHRCTYNACVDQLRRRGRHTPADADTEAASPEELALADDRGRTVQEAISALPERQRTALLLCHYQRLPQAEAAAVMDLSLNALESLLSRARRRLRSDLQARGMLDREAAQ